MPSVYDELCLACSGSAISGSQRQRRANDKYRKNSSACSTSRSSAFRSSSPDDLDTKAGSGSATSSSRTESAKGLDDDDDDVGDVKNMASSLSVVVHEDEEMKVFRTSCCARPICDACLQANARLARYVPCLACLGGVGAVAGSSSSSSSTSFVLKTKNVDGSYETRTREREEERGVNLNGALRDGDVFVLGDEEEGGGEGEEKYEQVEDPPPAYADSDYLTPNGKVVESLQDPHTESNPTLETTVPQNIPGRHYIQKNDTLRGLVLKYSVDGRTLCRLNNLPPTTLTTTPHLLHTRTVLDLPPSAELSIPQTEDPRRHVYDPEREREIELERTAKRLQLVAKEADWEVARAYAVLAQSSSSSSDTHIQPPATSRRYNTGGGEKGGFGDDEKEKENGKQGVTPQERAVDAYLEDDAWEARERAAGRGPGFRRAR